MMCCLAGLGAVVERTELLSLLPWAVLSCVPPLPIVPLANPLQLLDIVVYVVADLVFSTLHKNYDHFMQGYPIPLPLPLSLFPSLL